MDDAVARAPACRTPSCVTSGCGPGGTRSARRRHPLHTVVRVDGRVTAIAPFMRETATMYGIPARQVAVSPQRHTPPPRRDRRRTRRKPRTGRSGGRCAPIAKRWYVLFLNQLERESRRSWCWLNMRRPGPAHRDLAQQRFAYLPIAGHLGRLSHTLRRSSAPPSQPAVALTKIGPVRVRSSPTGRPSSRGGRSVAPGKFRMEARGRHGDRPRTRRCTVLHLADRAGHQPAGCSSFS